MKTGLASLGLNQDDKELLDRFFTSQEFKEIAEKDIGTLIKTIFDPRDNEIRVYGDRGAKTLLLDATLASIKGMWQ